MKPVVKLIVPFFTVLLVLLAIPAIAYAAGSELSDPSAVKDVITTQGIDGDKYVTLIVENETGGTVQGSGPYAYQDKVIIKALPEEDYSFKNWFVVSGSAKLSSSTDKTATFFMPDADVSIKAFFEKTKYKVTIQSDANGSAIGAGEYSWGETVSITAEPKEGYQLKDWEVISGGAALESMNTVSSFNMPKCDVVIKANFEPEPQDYEYMINDSQATITHYTGSEENVTIPERLGGYPVTVIGDAAFYEISNLSEIIIPDSISSIGNCSFSLCSNLRKISIGKSLANIGWGAFTYCYKIKYINADPENPNYKSENNILFSKSGIRLVLYPKAKLGSYEIPNNVSIIEEYAFCDCTLLTNIYIPQNVISIGRDAFADCTNLTYIKIPDLVTEIQDQTFFGCTSLKNVFIGENVTSIGINAFVNNTQLQVVEISGKVKFIKNAAFFGCSSLEDIYFWGESPQFGSKVFLGTPKTLTLNYHVQNSDSWAGFLNQATQAFCCLSINLQDGSAPIESIAFLTNFKIGSIPDPIRRGYNFGGWYTDESFNQKWDPNGAVGNDLTLYANWNPKAYSVTFDTQGGRMNEQDQQSKTVYYGSEYGDLPIPEKTGYCFEGWFTQGDRKGTNITKQSLCFLSYNQTLYAAWKAKIYKVTFDTRNGSCETQKIEVTYGNKYGPLPVPKRMGYTFIGWFTQKDGGGLHITKDYEFDLTENQTLYAYWKANTYTVRFDAEGGTIYPTTKDYTYGSLYGFLPIPARSGCVFGGWFTEPFGKGTKITESSVVSITDSRVLFAKWVCTISAKITNSSYGSVSGGGTHTAGIFIELKAVPKTGCMFLRWIENGRTKTKSCIYIFEVKQNRTLTAEFAVIKKPSIKKAASAGKGRITLKWTSVPGVTGYYIYHSTKSGSGFKYVGKTSTYTYTDSGLSKGKKYYYKIKAYYAAGDNVILGGYSNTKSAKAGR